MREYPDWNPLDLGTLSAAKIIVLAFTVTALAGVVAFGSLTVCMWLGCSGFVGSAFFSSVVVICVLLLLKPIVRTWEKAPRLLLAAGLVAYVLIGVWILAAKAGVFAGDSKRSPDRRAQIVVTDSSGASFECHPVQLAGGADSAQRYECDDGRVLVFSRDGRAIIMRRGGKKQ